MKRAKVGSRVVVTRNISLEPFGIVPKGERGVVTRADAQGVYDIRLDNAYHGLDCDGHLLYVQPGDDSVEGRVRVQRSPRVLLVVALAALVAFVIDVSIDAQIEALPKRIVRNVLDAGHTYRVVLERDDGNEDAATTLWRVIERTLVN